MSILVILEVFGGVFYHFRVFESILVRHFGIFSVISFSLEVLGIFRLC
jgi:hypothetical protein